MGFTHVDDQGRARMVDVSSKPVMKRTARAAGRVCCAPETLEAIRKNEIIKGDVLTAAMLARYDAVLISTDHSSYDYAFIVDNAQLVIDTRNATKNVKRGRRKIVLA